MKYTIWLFTFLIFTSLHSQVDTISSYHFNDVKITFVNINGLKQVLFIKNDTIIPVVYERLNDKGTLAHSSKIVDLYDAKYRKGYLGLVYNKGLDVLYTLYKCGSGERNLVNIYVPRAIQGTRVSYELLDPFTLYLYALDDTKLSQIVRLTKDSKVQVFKALDPLGDNKFYKALMRNEK